jgi:hypothetical protein
MLRSTLASPSLCPVRLDLSNLVGIGQRILVVLLGRVGSRAVRVQDVVRRLDGNGLCELGAVQELIYIRPIRLELPADLVRMCRVRYPKLQRACLKSEMKVNKRVIFTYIASSKFFSAMALFPRALSSSAMLIDFQMLQYEFFVLNMLSSWMAL